MWQRLCRFLVVFLLMFNGEIFGQENSDYGEKNETGRDKIISLSIKRIRAESFPLYDNPNIKPKFTVLEYMAVDMPECFRSITKFVWAPVIYTLRKDIGWFCIKELQLDKLTPVHFRFRLGSLDYVNWMEQKPNAIRPGL